MADIFGLPTHLVSHRLIHEPEEFYILQLDIFLSPTAVQVMLTDLFGESLTGILSRQTAYYKHIPHFNMHNQHTTIQK